MRSPWDHSRPQPGPLYVDEDEELEEEESREGVFATGPKPRKVRVKKAPPSPEPIIAPKCDNCGRRRRSYGPCWYCGDDL